ncbi:MAG TPA: M20/M25/M40 family metallo-hydrolase [Aggregatilineales bacterium]|jgi:hypothetical protein|nr:M20/M25/M40 family metallo-hydrolase [Aggregatilineales bacterium]
MAALLLLALVLGACSLTGTTEPPRATLMPQDVEDLEAMPTLGYSTPLPESAGSLDDIPTAAPPIGAYLYNTLNEVDANRMMNDIAILQGFTTRHVNSTQGSDTTGVGAAFRYLNREFEKIQEESRGNLVTFPHPFTAYHNGMETTQHNVVGIINGTEQNTPALLIGAHYDSRNDDLNDATWGPGADDNGSGVAAVLEMARILSQRRPRTTMIFVLFAAEEVNRQGSIAFYRDYIQAFNIDVKLMINIDTVGSNNDPQGNINDTQIRLFSAGPDDESTSRKAARMIEFISDNHTTDLAIIMQDQVDREGRYGDHNTFSDRGIPAVRFIEALEDTPRREGRDTIEYVEPEYLRRSTRTILTVLMALSDGLKAPQTPIVRQMENGTRRLVWQPVDGATGYVVALRRPGERVYGQVFKAPGQETAYECDCFNRSSFVSIAVAAVNNEGMMGPLSQEVYLP